MSNILFQCPKCDAGLAVDYSLRANQLACPACRQFIVPPTPDVVFTCPACNTELAAPRLAKGALFACPSCETDVTVPQSTTLRCQKCNVCMEVDESYYVELAGSTVECPDCGGDVVVPAIVISASARAEAKPAPAKSSHQKNLAKTFKLDEILDNIPQAQSLHEGKCPYCGAPVTSADQLSFSCNICGRIIRTIKRTLR